MTKRNTLAFLAVAALSIVACSSNNSSKKSDNQSTVAWSACQSVASLECAQIEVPMDYSQLDGEKIILSLIRKPSDNENKLGALLLNPGGPGGSGIEMLEIFHEVGAIPDSLLSAYDIVSFDPRGIGASTEVNCDEFGVNDIENYPRNAEQLNQMHSDYVEFATACSSKYGEYLKHLGSLNVVRDMDEMRKAMGEEKLNFIGYSYGTRLAALYLQTYPQTSGRIVLDGSMPPESSLDQLLRSALPAMQSNFRLMVSNCIDIDSSCDIDAGIVALTKRAGALADDSSMAAQFEFELLEGILSIGIEDPEFGQVAATPLYNYLDEFDVSVLTEFVDQLQQVGFDLEDDGDNSTTQIAVMCADDAFRPTPASLLEQLNQFNQVSDLIAEAQVAQGAICSGWPDAIEPLPPITSSTAPASLVIGGTTDAQTPLIWSEMMAPAIGGIFIRSEHNGHTVAFANESECVDKVVEQFLLDGLAPTQTQCLAE